MSGHSRASSVYPEHLVCPPGLIDLLRRDIWPQTYSDADARGFPLNAKGRAIAPEETDVYLVPPPFRTAEQRLLGGERVWADRLFDPAGIDRRLAVVIGDFGVGSDAPIVLDHRHDPENPRVLRLRWSAAARPGGGWQADNRWVLFAQSIPQWLRLLSDLP